MRPIIFVFLLGQAFGASLAAQNCLQYATLMQNARNYWSSGEFDKALKQLTAAREHCPDKSKEIDEQFIAFTREISDKYKEATRQTKRANSTATAAQRAARRAYANDLAYKSQTALRDGLRTEAYRLAEFAHRYVDDDNLQVTRALVDALYYNDNPAHPPLPWASNLEGHTSSVMSVAFSPDGKRLATGSTDHTVKIWDLESGKSSLTLRGGWIWSVVFSPDGKRLATGSDGGTAKIWDLESGKSVLTLEGGLVGYPVCSVAFSPDGKRLATESYDAAIIWDLESGKASLTLEGHTSGVKSVAFSPDGKRLATGSDDNTAKIWDLESGKSILTLEGHDPGVESVAFSPDGKHLATGSLDGTSKIWDLESGKSILTLEGHTSGVMSVAFSPDGKRLATGSWDNTAKIWDLESSKSILTLEGHTSEVSSVAFSLDGKRLATGSCDNTAKIWDLESGKSSLTLEEGHTSGVMSVAFSPDGKRLATGSWGNKAKIWDLESGKVSFTLEGLNSVAFSPDGKRLATGSLDGTAKIWNLESRKSSLNLEGHNSWALSVAFSPDGKRLATGSLGGMAKIWDLESGKSSFALEAGGGLAGVVVLSVAFSPDGKRLATGSGSLFGIENHKTAKIWDLESGKLSFTLEGHTSSVLSVAFSPDGKRLVTGSRDKTAKIWDLESGKVSFTLEGHISSVLSVAFSPDGKRLATGSLDGTAKIWDLESGKVSFTLKGHTSSVNSVAFSPDGKRLATGSLDGTAKIWDLTPPSGFGVLGHVKGLAGLTLPHLSAYGLENLLDAQPDNENILLASGDVWQIAAFAELYSQNTRNSQQLERTARFYARAERLYRAARNISEDSTFALRLGQLYQNWAKDILESGRPDTAGRYVERACGLGLERSECETLRGLFQVKTRSLAQILASESPGELKLSGDYYFKKEKWDEASQLYEKAESKKHDADVLQNLYSIAEKTGQAFDFERLLRVANAPELGRFAQKLTQKATKLPNYKERIPGYQTALRLRERQLALDTTAALRVVVSQEYNNLGFYQLFAPDGKGTEASIRRALELDPTNVFAPTNLAPALLLQGRRKEAESEYKKWKDLSFNRQDLLTYRDVFLKDLKALEAAGVPGIDFVLVRLWLE